MHLDFGQFVQWNDPPKDINLGLGNFNFSDILTPTGIHTVINKISQQLLNINLLDFVCFFVLPVHYF